MLRIDTVELNHVLGLRLNVWTSIVLFVGGRGRTSCWVGRAPAPGPRGRQVVRRRAADRTTDAARPSPPRPTTPTPAAVGRVRERRRRRRIADGPQSGPWRRAQPAAAVPHGARSDAVRRGQRRPRHRHSLTARRHRPAVGRSTTTWSQHRRDAAARAQPVRPVIRASAPARHRPSPPPAQGLYDPALRARRLRRRLRRDPDRRAPATTSWPRRSPRCATSTTAAPPAPSRTPATAPASCCRSRTRSCARSSTSSCPPGHAYAVGTAFLPGDDDAGRQDPAPDRGDRRRGGPRASSAGATSRSSPTSLGATARGVMPPFEQLFVRRRGRAASPAWRWSGWPSACASGSSTRPTSTSRRCPARTLVYKGMLTTDQLDHVLPRPHRRADRLGAGASCTRGSPPTPSRAGRWRTRSASSRTTARSTP